MSTDTQVINNQENTIYDNSIEFSKDSIELTKKIEKEVKKKEGIYFTPPTTIYKNLKFLEPYLKNVKTILEPSCGSCEFILALNKLNKKFKITGIEKNKKIYEGIKKINSDNIKIINGDFLDYQNIYPDLIIGNPPYFVMKKEEVNNLDSSYKQYFEGRANIFIIFIVKCLKMLRENSILNFVVPKSFLNCNYYNKTRKYIYENFEILNIMECNDKYIDTSQETIIIIIRKPETNEQTHQYQKNNKEYSLIINDNTYCIFGTKNNITKLKELFDNSTSLKKLKINCKVGQIVWNQNKDKLTNDNNKTLLVYNSNITKNELELKEFSNDQKKQYIDLKGYTKPMLIINRGNGVGKYSFNYYLMNQNEEREYLLENHIIKLEYNETIKKSDLIKLYIKIKNSFENEKTKKFIKLYFGNNAINTTELNNILPIYGFDL